MKKRRIAIASVLKPVDDTRAYEKMALTLAAAGHEVFLIGAIGNTAPSHPNVHFSGIDRFNRLGLKRLLAPLKVWSKVHKVKSDILIVNTHELLIVARLNRILFGTRVVYDIQENYYQNIIWTDAFPPFLRRPVANWVRLKERLLVPRFDAVFLAEKGYQKELSFLPARTVILENKCVVPVHFKREPVRGKIQLLFSGTLAESTGVFHAINLADQLHAHDATVHLHIIGYCAREHERQRIRKAIEGKNYVTLTGGDELQSHDKIMEAVASAHVGILAYPPSPHIENRIPTKLFEYLACRLPVIVPQRENWIALLPHHSFFVVDFEHIHPALLLRSILTRASAHYATDDFEWRSEEKKLLTVIEKLNA